MDDGKTGDIELTVVPFKKKEEEEIPEEDDKPTPHELFEKYMEKSGCEDIIICGYNEEGKLSFITNMVDVPDMNYALDCVKQQVLRY